MSRELVAVVLAGGVGNRFFPFTSDKVLFPWFGKPFAQYSVLDALPKEVSRVVLVTNSRNNDALSTLKFPVPHVTVVQRTASGMADAILSAVPEIQDCSLLIVNGDDVSDPSVLQDVVKMGLSVNTFGVIPGYKTDKNLAMGYVVLDGNRVTNIVEKPLAGEEPSPYVVMLGHFIKDSNILIQELKATPNGTDDVYERALSALMGKYDFVLHKHSGVFASLKYPWNVLDVNGILLSNIKNYRGRNIEIKSNVVLEGKIYIDDDVRIFENTKIIGPCYIGKGTIVGNNNIIRESHIGANCVTGFNTDITRSYIGDNCWFHTNYVGDSVLEENVTMGSGAVLANLRLDDGNIQSTVRDQRVSTGRNKLGSLIGKNVRIGVNASIMPGIKIGSGSFVGSAVVLDKDLLSESYCLTKNTYTIIRNTKSQEIVSRHEFKKKI